MAEPAPSGAAVGVRVGEEVANGVPALMAVADAGIGVSAGVAGTLLDAGVGGLAVAFDVEVGVAAPAVVGLFVKVSVFVARQASVHPQAPTTL